MRVYACSPVSVCMTVSSFMFISVGVWEFICQSLSVCVCVTCVHHFAFVQIRMCRLGSKFNVQMCCMSAKAKVSVGSEVVQEKCTVNYRTMSALVFACTSV